MNQADQPEIRELRQQVQWLTRTVMFMLVVLALNAGLIPIALGSILWLLLMLPVLAFTHHWIPPVARQIGRMISFFAPSNHRAA